MPQSLMELLGIFEGCMGISGWHLMELLEAKRELLVSHFENFCGFIGNQELCVKPEQNIRQT
jgi:hypothetical protein